MGGERTLIGYDLVRGKFYATPSLHLGPLRGARSVNLIRAAG
jgi:hypothetical protein